MVRIPSRRPVSINTPQTGFQPPAQGCVASATYLGNPYKIIINL